MTDAQFLTWLKSNMDSVRTPTYIYSEKLLGESLADLKELFPEKTRLFYSLKANPQPEVLRLLAEKGVYGEIASPGELRICELAGLPPSKILVGGVSKSSEYIADVCNRHCAGIVLDSFAEWTRLSNVVSKSKKAKVLLRINPGVALGGLDMAGDSQFGFDVETAIEVARECDKNNNIEFLGLHFYFGSQRLSVEPVVEMLQVVTDVLKTFDESAISVCTVDIGLGCGVPYLEKDRVLNMDELRTRLQPFWADQLWKKIDLWTEAGRALVGRSGYYVARVQERKLQNGKIFIYLDGGINVHNPGIGLGRFFRSNPKFLFLCSDGHDENLVETVDIVGNLCTSADSLGRKVAAPRLQEGDLVIVPNAGAYCQTTGLWGFNSQPLFNEAVLSLNEDLRYVRSQHDILLRQNSSDI